ncbi:MAG: aspartyl protease family protein [Cyanobacteria bacterium J06642_11]
MGLRTRIWDCPSSRLSSPADNARLFLGTGTILEAMGNIWTILKKKHVRFIQILSLSALTACQLNSAPPTPSQAPINPGLPPGTPANSNETGSSTKPSETRPASSIGTTEEATTAPAPSSAYREAINLASGAVILGQQATSLDDWSLIVGRWEQALEKLKQVPTDDPNYGAAQTKLKDYGQNLAQAQQRFQKLQQPPPEIPLVRPAPTSPIAPATTRATNQGARIPIIERRGGTPVIEASFNGKRYPMILDTGASHTHLPRTMANELGIEIQGQTSVSTASNNRAVVDIGYVDSISVGNIQRTNVPISIGDAVPIGLLGNDVYKDYDLIVQANSVEFRPR